MQDEQLRELAATIVGIVWRTVRYTHGRRATMQEAAGKVEPLLRTVRAQVLREAQPLVCEYCREGVPMSQEAEYRFLFHNVGGDKPAYRSCAASALRAQAEKEKA